MMISASHTMRGALFSLLLGLFSSHSLRSWLGFGPEGERVQAELPGDAASKMELVAVAVDVLIRRNLVDDDFFERLHHEFTRRRAEIAIVEAIWAAIPAITHAEPHP